MTKPADSLTRRSVLNTLAAFLAYFVRIGVGLFVNPVLLGFLGGSAFGIWQICQRLLTYVESAEGRGTQALKWILANSQQSGNDEQRRKAVGSAVTVWLVFLPVVIVVGVFVVWFGPNFINDLDPEFIPIVRLTCAVLVLRLLILGLAQIPEAVLQGMNAGYRMTWAKTTIELVSGLLLVTAAWLGWGIVGLAFAMGLVVVLLGLWLHVVAWKYISWYGIQRPSRQEVTEFFRFGIWVFAWTFVNKFLLFSDIVILGYVLNAEAVTRYTLTLYPAQLGVHFSAMLVSSSIPGLGGLIGGGELERAKKARSELLVLLWLFMVVLGSGVLLWNKSFIGLWVGADNFCGSTINVVLVAMVIQQVFFRADAFIIDTTLDIRTKVISGAVAAVVGIVAAVILGKKYGIMGVVVGQMLGRLLLSVYYPLLVSKALKGTNKGVVISIGRPLICMIVVLTASWYLGQNWSVDGWLQLAGVSVVTTVFVGSVCYLLGLSGDQRASANKRFMTALRLKN